MKSLTKLLLLWWVSTNAFGQEKIFLHPNQDPHWYTVVNETFDTGIDKGIWNSTAPWGPVDTVGTCDYANYPDSIVTHNDIYAATTKGFKNVSVNNGIATLQTRREQYKGEGWNFVSYVENGVKKDSLRIDSVWFNYTTGMLWSDSLYKYGYYEIKCQLPEAPANDLDKYKGLGPNFWLWSGSGPRYSEIDIFEIQTHDPFDFDGQPNNRFTHNFHFKCDTLADCPTDSFLRGNFRDDYFNVDFSSYRTFGAYWSENSLEYYYEDSLLHTSQKFPSVKVRHFDPVVDTFLFETTANDFSLKRYTKNFYPMYIIVDNYVPGRQFCTSHDANTSMPYNYDIDHVKVWLLKNACDQVLTTPDIDPIQYDYTVKQRIELGQGGGSLSSGESLILRANEDISLEPGYEASLGSELTLLISDCMEAGGVFPRSNPSGQKSGGSGVPDDIQYEPIKFEKPWENF